MKFGVTEEMAKAAASVLGIEDTTLAAEAVEAAMQVWMGTPSTSVSCDVGSVTGFVDGKPIHLSAATLTPRQAIDLGILTSP